MADLPIGCSVSSPDFFYLRRPAVRTTDVIQQDCWCRSLSFLYPLSRNSHHALQVPFLTLEMGSRTTVQTILTIVHPEQLLQYLPTYKVVICSACRYAIQPTAIARHLKEIHNIQRSNRKPYMQYVSSFELDEAEKVRCLEPQDFPVPQLPVQDGLRCEHPQCRHLCVSTKRMKSHWSVEHGRSGQAVFDWQPVPLQTFFRGNLLRYFTDPRYNKPREILRPASPICDTVIESRKVLSILLSMKYYRTLLSNLLRHQI